MFKRQKPITIPDNPRYFKVSTSRGTFDMRLPHQTRRYVVDQVMPLIAKYHENIHGLKCFTNSVERDAVALTMLNLSETYFQSLCAIIGSFWNDSVYELSSIHIGNAPALYGIEVYTELEDDGWTLEDIVTVGSECVTIYFANKSNEPTYEEVAERLDFFARLQVSTIS